MNEEYVNAEITRKLIDKGCPVTEVFISDGRPILYELPKSDPNWFKCKAWYIPTISQVLKWLREEKKIHLVVDIEPNGYFFIINYNITTDFDDKYQFDIYNSLSCYYDDKQAALAGISYVLDNLI